MGRSFTFYPSIFDVVIYSNQPACNFVLHLALLSSDVLKSMRGHAEEQSYLKNWVKADVFAIVNAHLNSCRHPLTI